MDTFITFSIVAIAAFWAVSRLRRRLAAKRAPSCAGCSTGCDLTAAQRSRASGCDVARITGFVFVTIVLAAPSSLFAQATLEEEPPPITAEIDRLKTAFEELSGGISVEGFFDMQATAHPGDQSRVAMGDFEVDLTRDFGKNVQVAAALVANDEGASLAVGFVDFHFFGRRTAPRGRLPIEKGFHLHIGRFDVPFGNDWQSFASKDRTELSAPLTTDSLMDGGYNATGLRILGGSRIANYTAFALRGEGGARVFGGRLGFTPFDSPYQLHPRSHVVDVGLSLLRDVDRRGNEQATFVALDSEAQIGRCRLRAEHMRKRARSAETGVSMIESSGWHLTTAFDAGQIRAVLLTPYARYDAVRGDEIEGTPVDRLSAGLNSSIFSIVTLKIEYQRSLAAPAEHSLFAQLVMVF